MTHQLKLWAFLVVFGLAGSGSAAQSHKAVPEKEELGKIRGEVNISLREERISAKLTYDYIMYEETETLFFYLNENFNVKQVKCRSLQSFRFDRQAKPLPSLMLNLKESLRKGQRVSVEIEYEGSLKGIYKKEPKFLELGLDNFWFPVDKNLDQFRFVYQLTLRTDEPGFNLVGNGRVMRKGPGWVIESRVADFDIDLVLGASLDEKSYRSDGYDLKVISKNLAEGTPAALLASIREILDFYNSSFGRGEPQRGVTAVIRPFPYVEGEGGYFRKCYFILPKTEKVQELFFNVAHELSHYWWLQGNQQNAWLNESFAEYSAMLATRKFQGVESYNRILEQKKMNSVNLPPIYGFDRTKNRQQTPRVLYSKGPVRLSELESELGEQKFMTFMTGAAEAKVRDTDRLIEVLAEASSQEMADRFLARLKE